MFRLYQDFILDNFIFPTQSKAWPLASPLKCDHLPVTLGGEECKREFFNTES